MIIGESLSKLINESTEREYVEEFRDYIGASAIGNPCKRAIWYAYKGFEKKPFSAEQIRTFGIGKNLEHMLKTCTHMQAIRIVNFMEFKPWADQELEIFRGSPDAVILIDGVPIILEIKTANDSSFNKFVKHGLRSWSPQYYSQVQAYMGFTNGKINGAYVLCLNKNTSKLHDEYVEFDEIHYCELKQKAKYISEANEAPERINKSPIFLLCSMCQYKEICHG